MYIIEPGEQYFVIMVMLFETDTRVQYRRENAVKSLGLKIGILALCELLVTNFKRIGIFRKILQFFNETM